jgi:hypothetical protein
MFGRTRWGTGRNWRGLKVSGHWFRPGASFSRANEAQCRELQTPHDLSRIRINKVCLVKR